MSARLAAISGKLKGSIFTLTDDPLIIGRETAANVCVADASVSRRHSKIEKKDEQFTITDLESLNGTFINDVPIRSRVLEHGDRVRIGESQFLFLTAEGEAQSRSSEVTLDDVQVITGPTLQVRFGDAVYQMERNLSTLRHLGLQSSSSLWTTFETNHRSLRTNDSGH